VRIESLRFKPSTAAVSTRLVVSALLLGSARVASAAQPEVSDEGPWARSRLVVLPEAGLADSDLAKALAAHGGRARKIGASGLYIVDLPANASETAVAQQLAHNPHFRFAEVDRRVPAALVPNDPYFGSEWHLAKIGAPAAWDATLGAGITIAVLDTGVDGTHPDLASRMVAGWNFYDNNADTSDVLGHGTGVAGAAAAATNDAAGVASVAGQARIMPLRISDPTGWAYASTVAQALTYAADHGARVANISFDGMAGNATVQTAAQYMKSKGGLVLVAAGNSGASQSIAPSTSLIPVSATDSNDQLASFSSYGSFVAMSAPGINIWSTKKGGSYSAWWGTSLATPITSGVVALIMATRPTLTNAQVENILYSTADDLGAPGRDPLYGYGRVDAAAAVKAAAGSVAADTTAPNVAIASPLAGSTITGVASVNVGATDNVGVTRVELRVNGGLVATDTAAPFAFAWDSTKVANGTVSLLATAYDAAGNSRASSAVSVNVSNPTASITPVVADTSPPAVNIDNPVAGSTVSGNVTITTIASDNRGAAGITQFIYVNGVLKASGSGATLSVNWNTRKLRPGLYTIQAVARDAAGNSATRAVQVSR
jgi:subtilisin family serine protease